MQKAAANRSGFFYIQNFKLKTQICQAELVSASERILNQVQDDKKRNELMRTFGNLMTMCMNMMCMRHMKSYCQNWRI